MAKHQFKGALNMTQNMHDEPLEKAIKTALKRYDFNANVEAIQGGYQNHVYKFNQGKSSYILRLTTPQVRTFSQVQGEVEWMIYLTNCGIPLSQPIPSKEGNTVEYIKTDKQNYNAVVFQYAKGKKLTYPEYLGHESLYETLGEITAKMHKASRAYQPKTKKRHTYLDNYYLNHVTTYIPKTKKNIYQVQKELMSDLEKLPKNERNFGLIHGDINIGNFHADEEQVTLFDFDECQYSWYIEDIAIQLFYTIFVFGEDSKDERYPVAKTFLKAFLKGYHKYETITQKDIEKISLFLNIREIIVFVGIHKKWDFTNLNQWQKDYLKDSQGRIENKVPLYDPMKDMAAYKPYLTK